MSNPAEYSQLFEAHGHPFKLEVFHDAHAPAPWEMSDGHGPVRQIGPNDPMRPGERWLTDPHYGQGWVYDWEGAIKIALRDKWGHPQMTSPPNLSANQIAAAAVQADFEYLRAWLRDGWHYVGVCVTHEASGAHTSVWGIESKETAYHLIVASECAADIVTDPKFLAWRKLLTDCEWALDVSDRLNDWAFKTERKRIRYGINPARDRFCQDMRDAAALLRTLAGN
jgi:hypothetical protein